MNITDFFQEQKKKIEAFLFHYITDKYANPVRNEYKNLDIPHHLFEFVRKGKMIRGGLVALSYSLYSGSDPGRVNEIIKAGAVMELLQSGLLVHDDIMDRDKKRRGNDTLFYQYVKHAELHQLKDSYHTGESLGMCAGDLFFFLAFRLMNELQSGHLYDPEIALLCSREMCRVAAAQMFDVYWGADSGIPSIPDVLELYLNKTGRYTFALPLKIGALLAGAEKKECEAIEKIGELLGVIFQIKDDEINLFGSEQTAGKSVGSDIKEGKKTLYISLLFEKIQKADRDRLLSLIGRPDASLEDIHFIKKLIKEHDIKSRAGSIIKDLHNKTEALVTSMNPSNKDAFTLFMEFFDYNLNRTR
ncbi:MAG: polyprenyl synthetase family protein [Spirochaetales bacterium]|nr:polyprenyl synthetase family protein [Spirochaetales bacterium]